MIKKHNDSHPLTSRYVNEYGQAICCSCHKSYEYRDLADQCGICGRWFCKNCAVNAPASHGGGVICKNCADRIQRKKRKRQITRAFQSGSN